jgi:transcription elongation factor S-II
MSSTKQNQNQKQQQALLQQKQTAFSKVTKIENPVFFRSNVRAKLNEFIQDENKSVNLEKGIYNYSIKEANTQKVIKSWDNPKFVLIYKNKLYSVYCNLKNDTEGYIEQIRSGQILSQNFAYMTHQELNPTKWKELIDKKMIIDKNKYETNVEAATDTFTCRKCKSNKCTYYQLQTRSADEPMTTFVTCIDCGCRWKC